MINRNNTSFSDEFATHEPKPVKITLAGNAGIGKTSLVKQLIDRKFDKFYHSSYPQIIKYTTDIKLFNSIVNLEIEDCHPDRFHKKGFFRKYEQDHSFLILSILMINNLSKTLDRGLKNRNDT